MVKNHLRSVKRIRHKATIEKKLTYTLFYGVSKPTTTNHMTIQFSIKKIRDPLNPKSKVWQETATRWLTIINGQEFDYYTGSLVAKKPTLDDVLSSLLLDADAIDLDFYSWCDEYGYTPCKESEFTYQSCLNNTRKLQKTGIDIPVEKARLQDY